MSISLIYQRLKGNDKNLVSLFRLSQYLPGVGEVSTLEHHNFCVVSYWVKKNSLSALGENLMGVDTWK